MFVVMAAGASEAEVLGVKSRILAEGLTPFDHQDVDHVVIAVVGEMGGRKPALLESFAALPGVERVTPINRPFKLTSREFHPEDTVIRVLDAAIGDGSLTVMAGPLLGREPRPAVRDGRRRRGRRGDGPPRRRLQAADEPVRVPGSGRRGAALPGRGARSYGASDHHRGDGALPGRHRRRVRRHPPDRHPQHAELLAASGRGAGRAAGHAQARLRRHGRGVADGRRIHRQLGQPERDPLRARHPDVRDVHPQHARPVRRCRCSTT